MTRSHIFRIALVVFITAVLVPVCYIGYNAWSANLQSTNQRTTTAPVVTAPVQATSVPAQTALPPVVVGHYVRFFDTGNGTYMSKEWKDGISYTTTWRVETSASGAQHLVRSGEVQQKPEATAPESNYEHSFTVYPDRTVTENDD